MYRPTDIAVDVVGDCVFVVEKFNNRISKWNYSSFDFTLDAGQVITLSLDVAGTLYVAPTLVFSAPDLDIANPVTATGTIGQTGGILDSLVLTDGGNGYSVAPTVTVVDSAGINGAVSVSSVSTPWGSNGDGTTGNGGPIGDGTLTDTSLYHPTGIARHTGSGDLYVTDTLHNRVRVLNSSDGEFSFSFGQGGSGNNDFYHPAGIAISDGNVTIVIADELNHRAVRYSGVAQPSGGIVMTSPTIPFNRPHGVFYASHATQAETFDVTDTKTGIISRYSDTGAAFVDQFGEPGTTGTKLFFPSSGEGLLSGDKSLFADTRNNTVRTANETTIDIVTNNGGQLLAGTGNGELYYPESIIAFDDANEYGLVPNTLNNRVEVYDRNGGTLTTENNFGSP